MPKLPWTVMLSADRVVFLTLSFIGQFLYYCFIAAIILGVARLFVLGGLAIQNRLCEPQQAAGNCPYAAKPSRC